MYQAWLRQAARVKSPQLFFRRKVASQQAPKPEPPPPRPPRSKTRERLDRMIARSPNIFKPTLRTLRDAPASYIVSFAILHEITAIAPLFGLVYAFHYLEWLPPYFAEGKWVTEGVEKFGRYFRKKGWIQETEQSMLESETIKGRATMVGKENASNIWKNEEAGRWLVEFATAYAVVKALLPLRIMVSTWAAPPFAKLTVIPIGKVMEKVWSKKAVMRKA